ncbi:capsule biosynthesis phosphatase [Silvimonas terrae]|uniref:Capsule biosynthesis phosphatase n=1 Tax=Silvimonas terrae TaxID=300266 RepID=A0A840RJX6_9NEIS|nr:capsular biosynthesis protein [Silvimonas terrae]MBB5192461.1 capsule biosynthesis phosphatase [Silvimonas terrae]
MINQKRNLVLDVDGTLVPSKKSGESYADLVPFPDMIEKVREYREAGFYIILYSARNMRTYDGNVGLINANTAKTLMQWLDKHQIPYDEIHLGKPWPGEGGFYVDDKAIRPNEFLSLTYDEIMELVCAEESGA